jgi:hypothetical protein
MQDEDRQEYDADAAECRISKTWICRNRILMLPNVNSCKARIVRNAILILPGVDGSIQ